jgi:transposase-like protein
MDTRVSKSHVMGNTKDSVGSTPVNVSPRQIPFDPLDTAPETEAIYTDQLPAYIGVGDEDTRHESVNHPQEEWVRGDVHTNGVESFWSLLKRSIIGAFHLVSMKHLDAYLDELEHRFNNRKNEYISRDTLMKLVGAAALPYAELVKAA